MSNPTPAPAPLSDERFDELAFMDLSQLMSADAAAVVGRMRDQLVDEIRRLQALADQATQFRVEGTDGAALVIRRSLSGAWAVLESEARGRRHTWTKRGWRIAAVLADSDVFCWPNAATAVAEARQALNSRKAVAR